MKYKQLIILLFIFIGLLGYIYFFERYTPSTQQIEEQRKKIFSINSEDISEMTIRNTYGLFSIKKLENNEWRFLQPIKNIRADFTEINAILTELQYLEFEREIKHKEVQIEKFGLNESKTEIKFKDKKREYTLKIGTATPLSDNIYVLVNSNKETNYYVIQPAIKKYIEKDFNTLRDKKVLGEMSFVPRFIELNKGSEKYSLEFTNETWFIKSPVYRKADEKKVRELINNTENIKTIDFADDSQNVDLSKYGLLNPGETIALKNGDNIINLSIGNKYDDTKKVYVKNNFENSVYGVDLQSIEKLYPTLFELSTKQLFFMDDEEISGIKVNYLGNSFEIIHKKEDWVLSQPIELKLNKEKISQFLKNLREYAILDYIDNSQTIKTIEDRLKNTVYELTIGSYQKDTATEKLMFYIDADLTCYVTSSKSSELYKIKMEPSKKLPANFMELAEKNIFNMNMLNLEELTYTKQGESLIFSKSNEEWYINGKKVGQEQSDKILSLIQDIKVETFIKEKTDSLLTQYNLKVPVSELKFKINDQDTGLKDTIIIQTGISQDNLLYAIKDRYPLIFTLDGKIISNLVEALQNLEKK